MKPDYNYFKSQFKMTGGDWRDFLLFIAVVAVFLGFATWSLI